MSSLRISAARFDMFLRIFSCTSGSAPRSAIARVSEPTSRSSAWMPRSSTSMQIVEDEQQVLDLSDASRRRLSRSCRVPRRSCRAPWHSGCWRRCARRRCAAAARAARRSPASRPAGRARSARVCGTSLSEAMRISTSVRISSESSGRMPADCSGSRCDSTMAAICGCSPLMICATAFASIHLQRLDPLAGLAGGDAVEQHVGLLLADRLGKHAPHVVGRSRGDVRPCRRAMPMKLSSTEVICSRDICLSSAMATPSFCTSRASSCFSTLAASCSPRLMSKIAAR